MGLVRFREFIKEGSYPIWVKVIVGGIIVKMRNLQSMIDSETDSVKISKLIGKQNELLSYISGLGVGVGTKDTKLMNMMKRVGGVGRGRK